MPELPEVETTLRAISKFNKCDLKEIKIHNRNLRWKVEETVESKTKNQTIINISRRAKYLIFSFNNFDLFLHLGMSGSLRIQKIKNNFFKKHDHAEFIFDDEKIIFNDPRRFGSIHISNDLYNHPLIQVLGPEPLSSEFNLNYLYKKTRNSATNIKNFIMNQKNVVGIGNIYASETLFLSNIRPTRKAGKISKNDSQKIVNNSKKVLRSAIRKGGTTLRDFYSADGNQGYFQINLNVYGRDNEICNNCKAKIKKIVLNNRAAYFCANCQS